MTRWSERRWWHYVPILSGCILVTLLGIIIMISYHVPGKPNNEFFWGFLITLCGGMGIISWLIQCSEYSKSADAAKLLALIEKKSGRVVHAQLQRIRLAPSPFHQRYEAKEYPSLFAFSTVLYPITVNPKVIPLSARIVVELGQHAHVPEWFLPYLANPAVAENAFRLQAFEIFQHRLPQELANRLNPYDASTVDELKGYVNRQLQETLPFSIEVTRIGITMKN